MKNFKEFIKDSEKTNESFTHNSEIPKDFAMAVHNIMHNKASHLDWEEIDKVKIGQSMAWIKSILTDNQVTDIEKELNWWREQLHRPEHN